MHQFLPPLFTIESWFHSNHIQWNHDLVICFFVIPNITNKSWFYCYICGTPLNTTKFQFHVAKFFIITESFHCDKILATWNHDFVGIKKYPPDSVVVFFLKKNGRRNTFLWNLNCLFLLNTAALHLLVETIIFLRCIDWTPLFRRHIYWTIIFPDTHTNHIKHRPNLNHLCFWCHLNHWYGISHERE